MQSFDVKDYKCKRDNVCGNIISMASKHRDVCGSNVKMYLKSEKGTNFLLLLYQLKPKYKR